MTAGAELFLSGGRFKRKSDGKWRAKQTTKNLFKSSHGQIRGSGWWHGWARHGESHLWMEGMPPRNILRLSGSRIAVSRITNLYPHECAILSRARRSAFLPCSGCEAKDLPRCSSGQPIIQAVLDSLMVQRSRSFGFAETVSKHFAVRVARLRMAHHGGEMDR